MRDMYKLREMLCEELEGYAKRGNLSSGDLETVHKLTDTIKNIDKIELLADDGSEYSHARRRRDSMGRYSGTAERYDGGWRTDRYPRDDGYSRTDGKQRIMDILESMIDGVQGTDRQTIERLLEMARKL
nr:MAG TPA: hypothetical protein [Caudoviricetes sp.]